MYCSPSSPPNFSPTLSSSFSASSSSTSSHPLLQLMSLSATLQTPNFQLHHQQSPEMLLKSGHLPGGSPVPIPSPNSSGGLPESPKSSAGGNSSSSSGNSDSYNNNNNNTIPKTIDVEEKCAEDPDGDEVLSIGDNEIAEDMMELEEEVEKSKNNEENDNDMSQNKTQIYSKEEEHSEEEEDRLSQNSHFSQTSSHRGRKYSRSSTEDSFSIKSLCSPTTPTPTSSSTSPSLSHLNNNHSHNASLIFSIANILRPDFGSSPSPYVPQKKSIKVPPSFGGGQLYKPYNNFLATSSTTLNPIDLSAPQKGTNGMGHFNFDKISPSSHKKDSKKLKSLHHHHEQRVKQVGQLPHPKANGNSSSKNSGTNNKGLLPNPATKGKEPEGQNLWPAWVYCTRYSDRPSSGRSPRARRERKSKEKEIDEKRPRTAFTAEQLSRLKKEFDDSRYLTEKRRQDLARELRLHENQIKIWFQNKRAKLKKATGSRGGLALQLMAQGLYNHSTISKSGAEDEDSD